MILPIEGEYVIRGLFSYSVERRDMKTKAAILHHYKTPLLIEEIDLEGCA